jgi:hypothetical protein
MIITRPRKKSMDSIRFVSVCIEKLLLSMTFYLQRNGGTINEKQSMQQSSWIAFCCKDDLFFTPYPPLKEWV